MQPTFKEKYYCVISVFPRSTTTGGVVVRQTVQPEGVGEGWGIYFHVKVRWILFTDCTFIPHMKQDRHLFNVLLLCFQLSVPIKESFQAPAFSQWTPVRLRRAAWTFLASVHPSLTGPGGRLLLHTRKLFRVNAEVRLMKTLILPRSNITQTAA